MRDHGGDLDRAKREYGEGDWLDLSTGINPVPWRVPDIPADVWAALPTRQALAGLIDSARAAYNTPHGIVPVSGAQEAIQIVPRLAQAGLARIVSPTYNEHGAALIAQGWQVQEVDGLEGLTGAELAVVVNPNNPTGMCYDPDKLLAVSRDLGLLVVDESFADPTPSYSLASRTQLPGNILILRSFGKFYGLAGLRLGFALGSGELVQRVAEIAGPWAVSGPAIQIGRAALGDTVWQAATSKRLFADAERLDGLAKAAGWDLVGGTPLFRTYETGNAMRAQEQLAKAHVWSRIFPYSEGWLRLGLPGTAAGWARLESALGGSAQ